MTAESQAQNKSKCSMNTLIYLAENSKANQHQLATEVKQKRKSCTDSNIAEAICALYSQGLVIIGDTENFEGETERTYDITREGIVKVLLQNNYNLDKTIDRTIPRLNQHFAKWIKARRRLLGETRTKKIIRDIAPLLTALPKQEKEDEKQFVQSLAFITAMPQIGITSPPRAKQSSQKTPKDQHPNKHKINHAQAVLL